MLQLKDPSTCEIWVDPVIRTIPIAEFNGDGSVRLSLPDIEDRTWQVYPFGIPGPSYMAKESTLVK